MRLSLLLVCFVLLSLIPEISGRRRGFSRIIRSIARAHNPIAIARRVHQLNRRILRATNPIAAIRAINRINRRFGVPNLARRIRNDLRSGRRAGRRLGRRIGRGLGRLGPGRLGPGRLGRRVGRRLRGARRRIRRGARRRIRRGLGRVGRRLRGARRRIRRGLGRVGRRLRGARRRIRRGLGRVGRRLRGARRRIRRGLGRVGRRLRGARRRTRRGLGRVGRRLRRGGRGRRRRHVRRGVNPAASVDPINPIAPAVQAPVFPDAPINPDSQAPVFPDAPVDIGGGRRRSVRRAVNPAAQATPGNPDFADAPGNFDFADAPGVRRIGAPELPDVAASPTDRTCRRLQRSWRRCKALQSCQKRIRYYMRLHGNCVPIIPEDLKNLPRRVVFIKGGPKVVFVGSENNCRSHEIRYLNCGNNAFCKERSLKILRARGCKVPRSRCERRMSRVRVAIRKFQQAASRCADTDERCVERTYRKIGVLRARFAKIRRACRVVPAKKVIPCANWKRWLKRQTHVRVALQAQVAQCGDEDNKCVSILLARVLRLNRLIRSTASRCRVKVVQQQTKVTCKKPLTNLPWVHSSIWKEEIMCDDMKRHWRKWMAFTNERRRRLHCESARCDSLDESCLRMSYIQIVHLARQVASARTEFIHHLEVCDRCGSIKLRFLRWLKHQRAKRVRLHEEICRCRVDNVMCHAVRVLAIRKIQREIKRRRYIVLHLPKTCGRKPKTVYGGASWDVYTSPETTTAWWTVNPRETLAPVSSVFGNSPRSGNAASTTVSGGIAMIVAIAIAMVFV